MKYINFSENWNNKLQCQFFTTLRLSDKYQVGENVEIKFKNEHMCIGVVTGKRSFTIDKINNFVAGIDTGYSVEETQNILRTMYKNKNINWDTQKINLYLIRKVA